MHFNKSEIEALVLVAGSEQSMRPGNLSVALNLDPKTLSRTVTGLVDKGLLEREGKEIRLARTSAAEWFKKLYFAHRASPLSLLIDNRKVDVLFCIIRGEKAQKTWRAKWAYRTRPSTVISKTSFG